MNLLDHFEPMEIPDGGLNKVKRNARSRAVKHKLASGSATLVFPLMLFGGLYFSTSFFFGAGVEVQKDAAPTVTTNAPAGNPGFTAIQPNATGLPGGEMSSTVLYAGLYYGVILMLLICGLTVAISTIKAAKSDTPALAYTRTAKVWLAVGITAPIWMVLFMAFLEKP